MKSGFVSILIKSLSVCIALLMLSFNVNAARPKYVPGEILVKFKPGVLEMSKQSMRRGNLSQRTAPMYKAYVKSTIESAAVERWVLEEEKSVESVQKELMQNENVLYAEPNYYLYKMAAPSDPLYYRQWGLDNDELNIYGVQGVAEADMNMEYAWDIQKGSSSVVVAVVDDGIDIEHSDLKNRLVPLGERRNVIANPKNSNVNVSSFSLAHGTNVAGVIGAEPNNGEGISGAAWDVRIMPILFATETKGDSAGAAEAFDWARIHGAHIVNFSYSSLFYSQTLADAVTRLENEDILLVTAAGNSDINNDAVPNYISSLPNKNILSVAASNQKDEVAYWSQYGQTSVDVLAPGENICTTTVNNEYACTESFDPNYSYIDGTSFAAPYAAGVAALIKSEYPDADIYDIKGRILAGVDSKPTALDKVKSGGRVNANTALGFAQAQPVLMLESLVVDSTGNGVLDSGETVDIQVSIENIWQEATNVSATISSIDNQITPPSAPQYYGTIAKGGVEQATFSISLSEVTGYRKIPFQIAINADYYSVIRHFNLVSGTLENNTELTEIIQTDNYDDIHYYYFTVPSGATSLQVKVESIRDIDMFIQRSTAPLVYTNYQQYTVGPKAGKNFYHYGYEDSDAETAAGFEESITSNSGSETIDISDPEPGDYVVAVYNFEQYSDTEYIIERQVITGNTSFNGGGSGSINLFLLLTLFGFGTALRNRKH